MKNPTVSTSRKGIKICSALPTIKVHINIFKYKPFFCFYEFYKERVRSIAST